VILACPGDAMRLDSPSDICETSETVGELGRFLPIGVLNYARCSDMDLDNKKYPLG